MFKTGYSKRQRKKLMKIACTLKSAPLMCMLPTVKAVAKLSYVKVLIAFTGLMSLLSAEKNIVATLW